MKPARDRRFCGVERLRAVPRRTHTFFGEPNETDEVVQARINAKIASGQASPGDRFVTFSWLPDDDE
jgi:hypothetical protein